MITKIPKTWMAGISYTNFKVTLAVNNFNIFWPIFDLWKTLIPCMKTNLVLNLVKLSETVFKIFLVKCFTSQTSAKLNNYWHFHIELTMESAIFLCWSYLISQHFLGLQFTPPLSIYSKSALANHTQCLNIFLSVVRNEMKKCEWL